MTRVAKFYGGALYELCRDENVSEIVLNEYRQICDIFAESPDYLKLFRVSSISKEEKEKLIDEAFKGKLNEYLLNFLKLIITKGYAHELNNCYDEYRKRFNEENGIIDVKVITAKPLSDVEAEKLKDKLVQITDKKIVLIQKIDASIIGGIKLSYSGKQLDGTIKNRFDSLRKTFGETVL